MSKRKKSTPVRWGKCKLLEEQPCEDDSESANNESVSEPNEGPETGEFPSRCKRKKIYTKSPANSVVFSEILLFLRSNEKINFHSRDIEVTALVQEKDKETTEFALKVVGKKRRNFYNIVVSDEPVLKSSNVLLRHPLLWVLSDKKNTPSNQLKVKIISTLEKSPIQNATNIVELFFGEVDKSHFDRKQTHPKGCNEEFFKEVQTFQKDNLKFIDKNVQHEVLIHKLCSYQAKAVQWMLFRESNNLEEQNTDWLTSVLEPYTSKCSKTIYFNKYCEELYLELFKFPPLPRGGILADEMGLGKTLSVISLVLCNTRKVEEESDNDDFLMPSDPENKLKAVIKTCERLKYEDEFIAINREDHLDPHEKLVYSKVSRGPALKEALNEWYQSKLAECSTTRRSKRRRMEYESLKCVCGNVEERENEKCVQCPECERFQHINCVGFDGNSTYFCPGCWPKQKRVKSRATLIVAPPSIYHQWFDEIKKHVKPEGLKNGVYLYDGLRQGFVQPSVLANHDIVITTYTILRGEINHAFLGETNRKLRNEERYLRLCSPLTLVQWWRLCLDEAQMVENDCSQINQMARLLTAVNRWSVTGTPIQKSVDDLYYLIDWLGVEPFDNRTQWNNVLYRPFLRGNKIPMYSVISRIFWRNSKEDVAGELVIPNQTVKYHFLKFSAVEQNFYMREHNIGSKDFSEGLKKWGLNENQTIDSMDKNILSKILTPLLNLRQACSHPLAVRGSKVPNRTGKMTLTELLEFLCNKTKVECEEATRRYIACLNGLAGISCIHNSWEKAVDYYRQVLQHCEEYKNKVQIDSLQRIHTMTNLAQVLEEHSEGIAPTLRDGSLREEAKELEEKYLQKPKNDVATAEKHLMELSEKVSQLEGKLETTTTVWWYRLIHLLTIDGSINELIDKITMELSTTEIDNKRKVELFLSKVSSIKGIEFMLRNWLSSIEENRDKALKNLDTLKNTACEALLASATDCHLRKKFHAWDEYKRKKCPLCVCESVLFDYECSLFDVSRKVLKREYEKVLDGKETKGSWRAQNAERCLRVLLNVSKTKSSCESWCLRDGRTHMQVLDAMKKEFKQIRVVWMSINHRVQAYDELSMCKLRLRVLEPGEEWFPVSQKKMDLSLLDMSKTEKVHILHPQEVYPQELKLESELESALSEFRKKYGTYLYLGNLGKKENPKPEPCPVCRTALENEWCVLQCGHSYCIDCTRILLTRSVKAAIACPICREMTKSVDLSFIDLSGKEEDSDIKVVGDHSTKVEGVVRALLELKRNDPNVKVLIFSTWAVVLKILEIALQQNGISFRRMPGHKYQVHIKEFKDPSLNVTALLLPISWGSKGLNLTEATHVFLVEPIMNPAEELQALSRVHRIGQTKETMVHRFLIRNTIEEKIHSAVSEAKDKWGTKKVTLEDLKNLFDIQSEYVTTSNENGE